MVTLMRVRLPTVTSWVCMPTNEKTSTASCERLLRLYSPFSFVTVPVPEPFTMTVAPTSGPAESATRPDTEIAAARSPFRAITTYLPLT